MRTYGRTLFNLFLVIILGMVIITALGYPERSRLFPVLIAAPMFVMAFILLLYDLKIPVLSEKLRFVDGKGIEKPASVEQDSAGENGVGASGEEHSKTQASLPLVPAIRLLMWMLLTGVGFTYIGFHIIPFFLLVMTRFEARKSWPKSLVVSIVTWLFVYVLFELVLSINL